MGFDLSEEGEPALLQGIDLTLNLFGRLAVTSLGNVIPSHTNAPHKSTKYYIE